MITPTIYDTYTEKLSLINLRRLKNIFLVFSVKYMRGEYKPNKKPTGITPIGSNNPYSLCKYSHSISFYMTFQQ